MLDTEAEHAQKEMQAQNVAPYSPRLVLSQPPLHRSAHVLLFGLSCFFSSPPGTSLHSCLLLCLAVPTSANPSGFHAYSSYGFGFEVEGSLLLLVRVLSYPSHPFHLFCFREKPFEVFF